jgi:adenylate cyclase
VGRRAAQRVHRTDEDPLIATLLSGTWRRATRLSPLRVALLASLALCLGYFPSSRMPAVQQVEAQLLDLRFRWRPPAPQADDIVLVLIDDESIGEIGRWPWSRAVIAEGLARLRAAGARAIGIDLLLAEPEVGEVPAAWLESLRAVLGDAAGQGTSVLDADRVLARFLDRVSGDAEFAAEMRAAGNVVLPFSFGLSQPPEASPPEPLPAVRATAFRIVHGPGAARELLPLVASSLLAPIPELAQAAATLGHTNLLLDRDGAARFEFPAVAYGLDVYPSFALEVARQHLGVPRDQVRLELRRGVWFGDRLIPTDERTRLVVNYRGPARFRTISFARLLAGDLAGTDLAGKVVLVGGTAVGIGETFATPFNAYLPGIEWRATVIDNILRQDFVVHRPETVLLDLGLLVLSGLLIGWLGQRSGLVRPSLGLAAAGTGVFATNLFAFFELGRWLDLFLPLLGVLAIYTTVVLYKYFIGERQERRIRAAFKHYLSPALVDQVARDPALLQLGGEQKELTVLFADIRDSTRIGARLPPREFVELLNEVMDVMTGVLFAHDGMLDKFTGDGLVAVFGAPLPQPDHPLRACRAALAMVEALEGVQRRWARPELPPINIGIGINTGSMLIGNMGSRERFSYTVIGDEANLGARLEAANKDFQTRILISEATWQRVKDEIAAREIDTVTFRGMARPVRIFEVIGVLPLPGAKARWLEQFSEGLAASRDQRFAEAEILFERVLQSAPDDRPSQIYLERCRARLAARPETAAAK